MGDLQHLIIFNILKHLAYYCAFNWDEFRFNYCATY